MTLSFKNERVFRDGGLKKELLLQRLRSPFPGGSISLTSAFTTMDRPTDHFDWNRRMKSGVKLGEGIVSKRLARLVAMLVMHSPTLPAQSAPHHPHLPSS